MAPLKHVDMLKKTWVRYLEILRDTKYVIEKNK